MSLVLPWMAASLCALLLVTAAQGVRAGQAEQPMIVATASSMRFVFRDLAQRFRERTGEQITLVFGSSGQLARQIENGAPYDLYAAADVAWIHRLALANLIRGESTVEFAHGQLVLLLAKGRKFPESAPAPGEEFAPQDLALLRGDAIRHVALANPELAPYGKAAVQALRRAGLWRELSSRLVYGENVRQVQRFVASGNADAGLMALSIVDAPADRWRSIRHDAHDPVRHTLTVLRRSTRLEQADRFVALLRGPIGAAILRRYGLIPVRAH